MEEARGLEQDAVTVKAKQNKAAGGEPVKKKAKVVVLPDQEQVVEGEKKMAGKAAGPR